MEPEPESASQNKGKDKLQCSSMTCDFDNSSMGFDTGKEDNIVLTGMGSSEMSKPNVHISGPSAQPTPVKSANCNSGGKAQPSIHFPHPESLLMNKQGVSLAKLGTSSLWKYWNTYNLRRLLPNPTKEQLINICQLHFDVQHVNEVEVIAEFISAARKRKAGKAHSRKH